MTAWHLGPHPKGRFGLASPLEVSFHRVAFSPRVGAQRAGTFGGSWGPVPMLTPGTMPPKLSPRLAPGNRSLEQTRCTKPAQCPAAGEAGSSGDHPSPRTMLGPRLLLLLFFGGPLLSAGAALSSQDPCLAKVTFLGGSLALETPRPGPRTRAKREAPGSRQGPPSPAGGLKIPPPTRNNHPTQEPGHQGTPGPHESAQSLHPVYLTAAHAGADNATDPNPDSDLHSSLDRGWCSTWGAGHFSTFDGLVYDFTGTCNYIFAAICKDASSTFSVQLRRGPSGNISRIIVELGASVVTVQKAVISIKDVGVVSLPYTSNGLQITPFGQSVRLVAKQLELELVVMWGPDAHLMVLVEKKYMGKMCGLCGNFDGEKTNEFLSEDGKLLEPHEYTALQKLDDPNEICSYEAIPSPQVLEAEHAQTCTQLLTLVSPECNVTKEPFVLSCQADMATCDWPGQENCSCATLSEYSRQCSMAGQPVSNWRGPGLCSVGQCPANQVYQECGEACLKTCSNPQHSCSSFCTFGCFCPEGMVLDDVSKNQTNHTCVPVTQCPCTLSGVAYAPGEVTTAACQTCQCTMGHWECTERSCPRSCSLEGGSFVTTFDARPYRFHGTCTYILIQSPQLPDGGSLVAVYDKSGYSHSETSLAAVIYMSSQDKIVISQDEVITNNGDTKWLPYQTRNITVFRQTSTHLQMATTFGLELLIQLQPVFEVYITVGPQFRGQTRGLCGNFNGDTTDDFTTSMGIAEGTASVFVDSWRAGNCPAALERETDPCSMSQLNKVCAETHCSVLVQTGTVFEKCHGTVNPKPFYKRCVYQACNYEETFPHICAALGDYAQACASQGILLWGWRSSVDNCTIPCTGNQTFSYNSSACNRTCLSLSDGMAECHPSAVPVDGCNCPEGTYLNHKAECVRKAQCPCLLDNKVILADQSTLVNGVICYCINGRLSCPGQPLTLVESCSANKTFQACSQSSENKFGAACAPTCQMLATGIPCVPTKCEPGCVCAEGLYENADGECVPAEECPCEFAGISYAEGAELQTDCQTCTCSKGKWTCQQSAHCSSTCTLYGEGHVVTFDGQRFVFNGNCEYILATDGCSANDSQPTFKILTENVVCGKLGVTCSRAIKIFLGDLSIVLEDRNYTVSGEEDPDVHFKVKASSLHLVLDITISSRYNLTVTWNKHMTVFIKIARASQDALCGLCGNYNGNMKDDFETRSKYVASSELEFVNSWKESPLCGDATFVVDPCTLNAFRRSWAERKCSIINSQTFAACHSQVYRLPYYEACVSDTCGCDTGGDCECLCDAVAAYAKACLDKGVCVDWRTPDFCPVYCDFYNTHTWVGSGQYQYTQEANCTWHYQPCLCPGWPQSVSDNIEGCYNCSQDEYFDHNEGTCLPCRKLSRCLRAPQAHAAPAQELPAPAPPLARPQAPPSPELDTIHHNSGAHHSHGDSPDNPNRTDSLLGRGLQHRRPNAQPKLSGLRGGEQPKTTPMNRRVRCIGARIHHGCTFPSTRTTGPPTGTSFRTINTFPTPPRPESTFSTQVPTSSTISPVSTSKTTAITRVSSTLSSQSTTSQSTSLTTQAPTPAHMSSSLGVTAIPSSPATNLTTQQPSTTGLLSTVFLTSSVTVHASSSFPTVGSYSTRRPSVSSLVTSLPISSGVCSVKELEEEITYQGCKANVTVTRCEGICASSASFNTDTKQVETHCGCCHPVSSYEKQLVLPCPDPGAQGQQLVLTLQVFSSCACQSQRCGD
ncbi:PREDICTED: mucin-6 [Ceratotherium simum simum]|uniref:Mucin-6 n=1 Tax=Ceratotherium simum simum TaxID=73337 RepID=A0ABM1DHD6_CERSS|nr:PREDICTED: mucin-6 [Ceratotherium simum simum]